MSDTIGYVHAVLEPITDYRPDLSAILCPTSALDRNRVANDIVRTAYLERRQHPTLPALTPTVERVKRRVRRLVGLKAAA